MANIEAALEFSAACSPRPVSAPMVAAARGMSQPQAQWALRALVQRGLAERMSPGRYRPTAAGLDHVREGARIRQAGWPADRRRPDSFRARLWAALRKLRKATVPELVQMAGRGAESAAEANARRYLRALVKAGYVTEMRGREPGALSGSNGFKRFLLARDPGPHAPTLDNCARRLRDPNTGTITPLGQTGSPQESPHEHRDTR